MNPRKKLSDILRNGDREQLQAAWQNTKAAEEFGALPAGEYIARVTQGEAINSKSNGTPGYRLSFKILEGEHAGRFFWHELWLTPAALPMAKRDLQKLGIKDLVQLDSPIPQGIRVKAKLALRKDNDGNEINKLKTFEVVGIDKPEADPFAPSANGEGVKP